MRQLKPVQRGNVRLANLDVLSAMLYIAENGCKWRALPERFAPARSMNGARNRSASSTAGVEHHASSSARCLPSSRRCSARRPPEPRTRSGPPSAGCLPPSPPTERAHHLHHCGYGSTQSEDACLMKMGPIGAKMGRRRRGRAPRARRTCGRGRTGPATRCDCGGPPAARLGPATAQLRRPGARSRRGSRNCSGTPTCSSPTFLRTPP